ncbi:hypothetical protein SBRY_50264 [Actinacidiphila bryophytorum]|uniref:Uncharacterized protein n=1 Tax=Actinacidiphila bryophytorum TaxID=1436133 RepID=A0A9W4H418_9ACTN|nr:hypothetical protein SBRY_50264 [Actinacidiphila bryophytorum]
MPVGPCRVPAACVPLAEQVFSAPRGSGRMLPHAQARPLPPPGPARGGLLRDGLEGLRPGARHRGRGQGAGRELGRQRRCARAVPGRGAAPAPDRQPAGGPGARRRRAGGPALLRHGLRTGRHPRRPGRAVRPAGGAAAGRGGGLRGAGPARGGRGAPRRQTVQPAARHRLHARRGAGRGPGQRQAAGRRVRADGDHRHTRVHGARTGLPDRRVRREGRRVRARRRHLRTAHRSEAVRPGRTRHRPDHGPAVRVDAARAAGRPGTAAGHRPAAADRDVRRPGGPAADRTGLRGRPAGTGPPSPGTPQVADPARGQPGVRCGVHGDGPAELAAPLSPRTGRLSPLWNSRPGLQDHRPERRPPGPAREPPPPGLPTRPGPPQRPGGRPRRPRHGHAHRGGRRRRPRKGAFPVSESVKGPAKGKSLRLPNKRHTISGAASGNVDEKNTVILRGYEQQVNQDIAEIAAGRAEFRASSTTRTRS